MSSIVYVPLDRIEDNPYQPRKYYGADAIEELAESIEREGQLQHPPARLVDAEGVALTKDHPSAYVSWQATRHLLDQGCRVELAFGHRRERAWRHVWERNAARASDLVQGDGCPGLVGVPPGTMPVDLQPLSDERMFAKAVEENRHRVDISAVESAEAMQVAMTAFGMGEEEVGRRFGVARSTVAGKLRLLRLPEPVKDLNREGRLSEQKCRQLLRLFSLDPDVETAAVQYDAEIGAEVNEYWTRDEIVEAAEEMESAAAIAEAADEWLGAVRDAAEQARREREPGFFDDDADDVADDAPDESPAALLSAEAARLHRVLDTHAEHVANLQRRHIVEEVRAAVQGLVRRDIADLSQAALRLADAGVSADVAALHDRAAAEIERYRGILAGDVAIEAESGEVFLWVPRPLVDVALASVVGVAPAYVSVEMNRLLEIYFTSDSWRTGTNQPGNVGRDVIERTIRKIRDGLSGARALVARMVEAGQDAADRGNARFSPAELVQMFETDLETYERELPAVTGEADTVTDSAEACTDPAPTVQETAIGDHGLPVPVLDEPHLWSALRPVWPEDHAKAGKQMLSDEIYDVQVRHYLPLLDRYETELVSRSNVKEDITRGARRAVQHVANLRCAYALDEAQLRAFVKWADANLPDTVNGTVQRKDYKGNMETRRLADENYAFGLWSNHDPGAKRFDVEDLHAAWSAALVMGERRTAVHVLSVASPAPGTPSPASCFVDAFARLAAAFAYHLFYAATPADIDAAETPGTVATATSTRLDVTPADVEEEGDVARTEPSEEVRSSALGMMHTSATYALALLRNAESSREQTEFYRDVCRYALTRPDDFGKTLLALFESSLKRLEKKLGEASGRAGGQTVDESSDSVQPESPLETPSGAPVDTSGETPADLVHPERRGYPAHFPRVTTDGTGTWETQDRPDAAVRGGNPVAADHYVAYEAALYGRAITQDYRDELNRAVANYTNTSADDARSSLACGFVDRDRASLTRLREVLFHALRRGPDGLGATKHKLFKQYTRKVDKRLNELEPGVSVVTSAETQCDVVVPVETEASPTPVLAVTCPRCGAGPSTPCRYLSGRMGFRAEGPHPQRVAAATSAETEPDLTQSDAPAANGQFVRVFVDAERLIAAPEAWGLRPFIGTAWSDAVFCTNGAAIPAEPPSDPLREMPDGKPGVRPGLRVAVALSAEDAAHYREKGHPRRVCVLLRVDVGDLQPATTLAEAEPEATPVAMTPEQRLEALASGDVDVLHDMSDATLSLAIGRAFTDEWPAELDDAVRLEQEKRAAAFDAPADETQAIGKKPSAADDPVHETRAALRRGEDPALIRRDLADAYGRAHAAMLEASVDVEALEFSDAVSRAKTLQAALDVVLEANPALTQSIIDEQYAGDGAATEIAPEVADAHV